VVTWRDASAGVGGATGDTSNTAVKAQVFGATGAAVGGEIRVNTATVGIQQAPQITALPDGGFVVTWQDNSSGVGGATGDTSSTAIKAQVFGRAYAATEQTSLSLKGAGLSVGDVDGAGGIETVTLSVGQGTLSAAAGDSGVTIDAGNGTASLQVSGTIAQLNAFLGAGGTSTLAYINGSDTPAASTSLTLSIKDNSRTGSGGPLTDQATATIVIAAVNDAPVANNQSFTTLEDTSLAGSLTATDIDSDAVTFTILQQPTNGTLTLTAVPGTLTTVAASSFNGPREHRAGFSAPQNDAQPFDRTNDLAFSGNGFAKAAVARDNIADTNSSLLSIHQAQFANDGYYGNGSSWIANSANDWIKIDLGRDVWINDVLLGRDRTGNFDDRDPGRIQIAVVLNDDVYANGNDANDASEYHIVFDSANVGFDGLINGAQTLQAAFASTHARFVKVIVANNGADLDEVQVFGSVNGPSAPFVYVPNPNANGPDSFTFKATNDGSSDSTAATVSLNVSAVNDPAVISSPVLMDSAHHDGSFESNSVLDVNKAPTALPPVWTVTSTGFGGLLPNPPHITVLAGADGADAIFADGPSTQSTTATSHNLLGGGYSAVHAGDVFAWSFQINSWSAPRPACSS
jgi:hypothetical protein